MVKSRNLIVITGVLGEEIVPTAHQSQRRDVYVVQLLTQRIASYFTRTEQHVRQTTLRSAAVELQPPSFLIKSTTCCDPATSDCVRGIDHPKSHRVPDRVRGGSIDIQPGLTFEGSRKIMREVRPQDC